MRDINYPIDSHPIYEGRIPMGRIYMYGGEWEGIRTYVLGSPGGCFVSIESSALGIWTDII